MSAGVLYVVATPIGNLEDITVRAVRVLGEVALIAAEDTRHTRKLLQRYGITTPLTSYFEHNQRQKAPRLIERIQGGEDVALVSDAGTPGISDPGFPLLRAAIEAGIRVVPIPGPAACIAAASVAGLPLHEFLFAGFCSPKSGKRRRRLESLRELPSTLVFYESPHRLIAFLQDAQEILGDRQAVITCDLTKFYEETQRGRLSELRAHLQTRPPRGEYTVLIAGYEDDSDAAE